MEVILILTLRFVKSFKLSVLSQTFINFENRFISLCRLISVSLKTYNY